MAAGSVICGKSVGGVCPALNGDYWVDFVDGADCSVHRVWVNSGEDATPPIPQEHEYLTFHSYVGDFTNVTKNTTIGVAYETTDGDSHVFMIFNDATGFTPTFYFFKNTTDLMTVNWGDGDISTTSASGIITLTKPNPYATDTEIKHATVNCAGTYRIAAGTGSATNYKNSIVKYYCGSTAIVGGYSFYQNYALENVVFNPHIEQVQSASNAFIQCYSLKCVIIPNIEQSSVSSNVFTSCYSLRYSINNATTNDITSQYYNGCYSLKYVTIPTNITTVGLLGLGNCRSIEEIDMPTSVTSLDAGAFQNMTSCKNIILRSTTLIPLVNVNVLTGNLTSTRYYVPDSLVASYKAATNWITYSNQIYPLSEYFAI